MKNDQVKNDIITISLSREDAYVLCDLVDDLLPVNRVDPVIKDKLYDIIRSAIEDQGNWS